MGKTLIVLGRTGIGKSMVIKEMAKERAKGKNKEFRDWNSIDYDTKIEIIKNPDKNFVFVDLRMTQLEPSDLRGLPNLNKSIDGLHATEWVPNLWTLALHRCEGVLFFDEINLCGPTLQATLYQILLERHVGEIPMHEGVTVFGAGNLTEDRAGTYELGKPIRTRAGVYELSNPSVQAWTDWAIPHEVDSRVVTFLQKFEGKIFVEDDKADDIVSPRSWESVSDLIRGLDNKSIEDIHLFSAGQLGEGVSQEFAAFLELMDQIPTPEQMLNKKRKIPARLDLKYACIASITEHFRQKKTKDRLEITKKFIDLKKDLSKDGNPEFFILGLRFFKGIQKDICKQLIGTPHFKRVMEYSEYLK